MKKIQMQVSEKVWNYLHKRKQIKETFDDVLQKELNIKNGRRTKF